MQLALASTPSVPAPVKHDESSYYDVTRLRRQYTDYHGTKRAEIDEQKVSRRYYHGSHWTAEEVAILKKRGQPPTTYNRIARKINTVIGTIERLRQDPKAYPRTPEHEKGAEVASAVLRYVLDHNEWKGKSPVCALHGAVDGIGGIEYNLVTTKEGDPDLELHIVDPDTFFYDPRSFRDGFSDARFLGVAKWVDLDLAISIIPEKQEELGQLVDRGGSDMTAQNDRELAWVNTHEKKVRLVDHWYVCKSGKWCWALYVDNVLLKEGEGPFIDERGKSFPKYRMFSGFVDQDGDRYGFIRNQKSAQDEINHRLSKALHMAHSRRLILKKGAVDDIEKTRKEWSRPDGVIEENFENGIRQEDQSREIAAQFEFAKAAKEEIENFGPNPALVGQGLEDSSGRAIALLQQAGIAELGPYLLAFKQWKTRVYRDIWNIVQQHWQAERWIRVTDDEDVAQFFQVNKLTMGPYGPALENALGQLDVDIILDEGPDTVNMQADSFSVLQSLGPQFMQQFPEVALELSPIQGGVKKRMLDKIQQAKSAPPPPDPKIQQMQMQAQIDAQRLQIEQQRAAVDAQREQQKAMADAQLKREMAEADYALEIERMNREFENEQRKLAMNYEHEARKQEMAVHTERIKHSDSVETERKRHEMGANHEREKAAVKVESEQQVRKAQTSEPLVEANIDAIKEMAKSIEGLAEKLTAPKRLIRDAQGRPTGVEVVT